MEYIFVINPEAGPKSSVETIKANIKNALYQTDYNYGIHITSSPGEATEFVSGYASSHKNSDVCFIACGGDGTINEVVSGIIGHDNAYLSVYPCGSGNDFVKYYGGSDSFMDIKNILDGRIQDVDVMKIGDKYSINICNFGFDTAVADTMDKIRRFPIIGGSNAYYTGIIKAIFTSMKSKCQVYADGKLINNNGELLLCTLGNGSYVGGSFNCSPKSDNTDGLIELCLVKPVSIFKFIRVIEFYKNGTFLDKPEFRSILHYTRAKNVEIKAPDNFKITIDGEVKNVSNVKIENLHNALHFVVPKNAPITPTKQALKLQPTV